MVEIGSRDMINWRTPQGTRCQYNPGREGKDKKNNESG